MLILQKQVKEAEYGSDVQGVKVEYERHQKEHKIIDQVRRTNPSMTIRIV